MTASPTGRQAGRILQSNHLYISSPTYALTKSTPEMQKFLFLLITVLLVQSIAAQTIDKRLAGIDTFINRILSEWKAAGVTVTVVEKNKVIMAKGFGYRDFENKVPVTENTLFAIGSCTKAPGI